jgi:hypothetical protein
LFIIPPIINILEQIMSINLSNQFEALKINSVGLPLGALSGSVLTVAPSVISGALDQNPLTHDPLYTKIAPRAEKRTGSTFLGACGYVLLNGAKLLGTINGMIAVKKIIEKLQRDPLSKIHLGAQCLASAIHLLGSFLVSREKKALYEEQKKKYLINLMKEKKSLHRVTELRHKHYLREKQERQEEMRAIAPTQIPCNNDNCMPLHKLPLYTIPEE